MENRMSKTWAHCDLAARHHERAAHEFEDAAKYHETEEHEETARIQPLHHGHHRTAKQPKLELPISDRSRSQREDN
jgi:hypothetical protein